MKPTQEITQDEILSIIEQMVKTWGPQRSVADHLKISNSYMSDILASKRLVSDEVARKLGYKRVVKYARDGSLN